MEGCDVAAFKLCCKDAEVTYRYCKRTRLRLAFRVLPYLESSAALKIDCDAGMALMRHASGVWEHAFCYCVVFQNLYIDAEHFDVPVPRLSEIYCSGTDLLDSGNHK